MRRQANRGGETKMLEEYDFRNGVRGKYARLFSNGKNIVILDPDVAEVFPDSESVNQALRALVVPHSQSKPKQKASRKITARQSLRTQRAKRSESQDSES